MINTIQTQLNTSPDTLYPCDRIPGKIISENGAVTYITAKSQILLAQKDGTGQIWKPSLYQSCMHLEQKEIRTLTIIIKGDELHLQTRYQSQSFALSQCEITISPWQPIQQKKDCSHCTNCGQCSW